MASEQQHRLRIGYAMPEMKRVALEKPSFLSAASSIALTLVPIDRTRPIGDQGPFDLVIQKYYDQSWREALKAFTVAHPSVTVLDPPEAIDQIHNRTSMLEAVSALEHRILGIASPVQRFVREGSTCDVGTSAGLRFPLIAKSLLANSAAGSHDMYLVLRPDSLRSISPPIVLQEFVNHGGVVFKVYVAGDRVKCVRRASLPDVNLAVLTDRKQRGLLPFSQISAAIDGQGEDDGRRKEVEAPSEEFVEQVAAGLRQETGLTLFNFDMIRDTASDPARYLVIDINYFPGYEKVPGYECMLAGFLADVARGEYGQHRASKRSELLHK